MPDIFVPADTTGITSYYKEAAYSGLIRQFTFEYTDENRAILEKLTDTDDIIKFLRRNNVVDKFAYYADKKGLQRRNLMLNKSRKLFEENIFGGIIYSAKDTEAYIRFLNRTDPVVLQAIRVMAEGKAFPEAPVEKDAKDKTGKKKK